MKPTSSTTTVDWDKLLEDMKKEEQEVLPLVGAIKSPSSPFYVVATEESD